MKCKNCGAELMEGMVFCPECGEKNEVCIQNETAAENGNITAQPKKFCPQCGAENQGETGVCVSCGFTFSAQEEPVKEKKEFKWKKGYTIGIAAAVVVAVGIGVISALSSAGGSDSRISKLIYLIDNEINIMAGKTPITIEDDFAYHNAG